ncbi:MAG: glucose-6-phosphate dehydrogenase [Candidatus Riflebacteria bacterium]|nr:glucose-6-phosphate dehydrogenase [Candidatus Riflebacteria bacterium]
MPRSISTCTSSLVIFGGTGDLSCRKLIPALLRLKSGGYLPSDLQVIISGRNPLGRDELINHFRSRFDSRSESYQLLEKSLEELAPRIHYIQVDPQRPNAREELFRALRQIEREGVAPARLFYLALPPQQMPAFLPLLPGLLGKEKNTSCLSRILVEKPFGHDFTSALELNNQLLSIAHEDQIMRIDHYLGKEAIQNILVLRFANVLFEPVWNRNYIDHVQISFAEKIGVGSRSKYFDSAGILRDVVQNHLLQVLSLTAMEPPISNLPSDIRREKMKILRALQPLSREHVKTYAIRGRYEKSDRNDVKVRGYLEEEGVEPTSTTETYAALKTHVDSWRWGGVPFYLRAGKRLSTNLTEISIFFKLPPHFIFEGCCGPGQPNVLNLRVQPDEGIQMLVQSKKPGMELIISPINLDFSYQESFGAYRPDAYERLLLDALHGDLSLFLCKEEIDLAWKFIDPIIEAWKNEDPANLEGYPAGSDGPKSAENLLKADGRAWKNLT